MSSHLINTYETRKKYFKMPHNDEKFTMMKLFRDSRLHKTVKHSNNTTVFL